MKRPTGVTVIAVLSLIFGAFGVLSFIMSSVSNMTEKPQFTAEMYREMMSQRIPDVSDEEREKVIAQMEPMIERMVAAQNEIVESDILTRFNVFNGFLSAIYIILGIGLLRSKEIMRKGTVWFAMAIVPIGLIMSYVGMKAYVDIMSKHMSEMMGGSVNLSSILPVVLILQGLLTGGISWLIIHYLNRAGVKQAFH